ncbi:transposase [Streptomyces sp. NPDC012794]|uniref:transposase n=1 Tax=Streptomyces sp. NPDC012794 TaxID=3364850 RepID=UPI003679FB3D
MANGPRRDAFRPGPSVVTAGDSSAASDALCGVLGPAADAIGRGGDDVLHPPYRARLGRRSGCRCHVLCRCRCRSAGRTSSSGVCSGSPKCAGRRADPYADHKSGGRKGFAWTEYRDLLIATYQHLGGPIVHIWDNLNVHKGRRMREFIDAHDWFMVYQLAPYAPGLNLVEVIWSLLPRTSQANIAFDGTDDLICQIQYRSDIIDGCLATTGLTLTTPRLQPR